MRTRRLLLAGGAVGLFAGCASPADVQAEYDRARESYSADMVTATEWNTHTLGIPASGWLAIVITGVIVGAVLLGLLGYAIYRVLDDRRTKRYNLDLQRERTATVAAERGPCAVCGAGVLPLDAKGT